MRPSRPGAASLANVGRDRRGRRATRPAGDRAGRRAQQTARTLVRHNRDALAATVRPHRHAEWAGACRPSRRAAGPTHVRRLVCAGARQPDGDGEMSEWLKEHAWKTKLVSSTELLQGISTHTRSAT